ncbi:MAG TPA: 3-deoxy-8-phosphooctulonate synthase [Candidatus Paceibacterota bacterium]|nr:3-deoxy-8-phosphooctulonate synthase [Verrucomicrobiota bacterium]HOX01981.1 3-deoxy-8-phosphooctulonate synthase [Verrucomicrobiota bacterium]HRZ44836.1 3-deoxy-8-phosphooctulonate synthase [Candidatus Paceibacterota bacterium]HRZ93476.1 3-deoxy-8-phosphooctulonate synthase [Candidatus Paceibacterota bacterium]
MKQASSFFLIAGPCVVESARLLDTVASHAKEVCSRLGIPLVFKASYDKANRTRVDSFRGLERQKALELLAAVRARHGVPVLTDVHESADCPTAAAYVDWLQIPSFLSRQTDLLLAAGRTGKGVNIKKGQFLAPEAMRFALEKVRGTGNHQVWITERGTTFGYHDLVVDMTGIPRMRAFGAPVVVDCTHSVQKPNQSGGVTGGDRELIGTIALAALAAGADGLFLEVHPEPARAACDADSQLPLAELEPLLRKGLRVWNAARSE